MKQTKMNKKRVLVFGTFDVLHPGHQNLFKQALALGDELHVVIARDETVEQVKRVPPNQNEQTRKAQVEFSEFVKKAYLGYLDDKYRIIEEIKPDIIALGYDQDSFVDSLQSELDQRNLKIEIIRLQPFHPELYKSSRMNGKGSK